MKKKILKDMTATQTFAESLGQRVMAGDVIVLTGQLGTGKTTLTKGLAQGLGVKEMVKSPTYTLIREYQSGRLPLYHMDVYRLETGGEDLGLEEYFENGEGVSVVEWGENIREELPSSYVELILTYGKKETERKIEFKEHGPMGAMILRRLLAYDAIKKD